MKKVFIGLLIVAAGATIFFLLQKKNQSIKSRTQRDLIIGKWKLDSLYCLKDSSFNPMTDVVAFVDLRLKNYEYEFTKKGAVEVCLKDSLTKDGARFEWINEDQLRFKESPAKKDHRNFESIIVK